MAPSSLRPKPAGLLGATPPADSAATGRLPRGARTWPAPGPAVPQVPWQIQPDHSLVDTTWFARLGRPDSGALIDSLLGIEECGPVARARQEVCRGARRV